MVFIVEDLKSSSPNKKEFRSSKTRKYHQKVSRASLLEAIAQGASITSYTAEDGTVKMKILVKKQDLKQVLGAINPNAGNCDNGGVSPTISARSCALERRLYELMRKKKCAQAKGHNSSSWRPNLQSIPEENRY